MCKLLKKRVPLLAETVFEFESIVDLFVVIGFKPCEKGLEISFFYPNHLEECLRIIPEIQEEFVELTIDVSDVTDELIFKGLDEKVMQCLP